MLANLFIVATLLLSPTLVTAAERKLLRSPRNHLSHPANGMVKRARGGQNHGGNGGWGRGPHGNWTGGRSSNASSTTSADQESSTAVAVVEVAVQATSETSTSETIAQKTKTTTSVAASETTSTSSSSGSYSGQATYFYQEGGSGACGNVNPDSALIVALQVELYGDTSSTSQYCGKSLTITNTDNGNTVTATVADACPGCVSEYSLDLSVATFEALGSLDTGVLPITWSFV